MVFWPVWYKFTHYFKYLLCFFYLFDLHLHIMNFPLPWEAFEKFLWQRNVQYAKEKRINGKIKFHIYSIVRTLCLKMQLSNSGHCIQLPYIWISIIKKSSGSQCDVDLHIFHLQVGPDHELIHSLNLLMDVSFFTFLGSAFHIFGPSAIRLLLPYVSVLRFSTSKSKG